MSTHLLFFVFQNFRPQLPVVIGGLASGESALGFVRARVKRHRWHKRVLKSNNPIIFSVSVKDKDGNRIGAKIVRESRQS